MRAILQGSQKAIAEFWGKLRWCGLGKTEIPELMADLVQLINEDQDRDSQEMWEIENIIIKMRGKTRISEKLSNMGLEEENPSVYEIVAVITELLIDSPENSELRKIQSLIREWKHNTVMAFFQEAVEREELEIEELEINGVDGYSTPDEREGIYEDWGVGAEECELFDGDDS